MLHIERKCYKHYRLNSTLRFCDSIDDRHATALTYAKTPLLFWASAVRIQIVQDLISGLIMVA